MNFLRNTISFIYKNTPNELHLLRQNRLFYCTTKNDHSGTKSSENNRLENKSTSISEQNAEQIANDEGNLLEKESAIQSSIESGIMISSYNTFGFRLNKYVQVIGPIVLFPRAVFAWHVERPEKIDFDSLMIFGMVQPKVDTLIVGIGADETTKDIGTTILKFAHEFKINVEILSTELACTQYNLLTNEGRMVGAALIPPKSMSLGEDDMYSTLDLDGKLFTVDMLHSPDIRDLRDGKFKLV